MLENDLVKCTSTSTSNWAGNIKRCLESCGFQDVWTDGVVNEASFLSLFKRKMVERFQEEWHTKIFNSDRFATYRIFKLLHGAEKYLNDITIKKFRDALVRLRFGINELKVNKRYESQNIVNENCAFCPGFLEDETHFLFHCLVYTSIRQKYIAEFTDQEVPPLLKTLLKFRLVLFLGK